MKYEDMTDNELNALAATKIMGWQKTIYNIDRIPPFTWWMDKKIKTEDHSGAIMHRKDWNPTNPDSNQIQNYIFPVLMKKYGNKIYWRISGMFEGIFVGFYKCEPWSPEKRNVTTAYEWCGLKPKHLIPIYENFSVTYETLNKTTLIACLRAMEKLNK